MRQSEEDRGLLGKGASGEVRLVYNRLTQRQSALKKILLQDTSPEQLSEEAYIGALLPDHPNIVRLETAHIVEQELHLYMEYVLGGSLGKRIREVGPLSVEESLTFFTQLLQGLDHAHLHNVSHGDIKPGNLLIREDGILKITDWGTAAILGTVDHRSQAGGTYSYMAPEHFMIPPKVGRSADIWAAGVVLYEMLTKKLPFQVTDPKLRNNPFAWKPVIESCQFASLIGQVPDSRVVALQELLEHCFVAEDKRFARPSDVLDFLRAKNLSVEISQDGLIGPIIPLDLYDLPTIKGFPNTSSISQTPIMPVIITATDWRVSYPALASYISSMCQILTGTFEMGSNKYTFEEPIHNVLISGFQLGKTPVTVRLWHEYCDKQTPKLAMSTVPSFDVWKSGWDSVLDHPIVNVSWEDCVTFCNWASGVSSLALELPSEVQWEYASRGGLKSKEFPWGDTMRDEYCWYTNTSEDKGTASVLRNNNIYKSHPYDLLDMSGNVWEWCRDWYAEDWYKQAGASVRDAENTCHGERQVHVLRGGSWFDDDPDYLRCADRGRFTSSNWNDDVGFRLSLPGLH
jgi:formylglycine-generating enzyme